MSAKSVSQHYIFIVKFQVHFFYCRTSQGIAHSSLAALLDLFTFSEKNTVVIGA